VASDPIPISALQHYVFCPRQCALIHLEGLWVENRLTVEGRRLHRNADGERSGPRGGGRSTSRRTTRTVRGLPLSSERLGLIGKADIVEFRPNPRSPIRADIPFPVEYKRGKPKKHDADLVQLCAQALCLEEMLALPEGSVGAGAIFYGVTRHRLDVAINAALRTRTRAVIDAVRDMLKLGVTPRARCERKCARCSMLNHCLPGATGSDRSASDFIADSFPA
jgi:CRISPR-associated exonuclease Cas4